MDIRPLLLSEIDEYIAHILRGFDEVASGRTPVFSAYTSVEQWNPQSKRDTILSKLHKSLSEPGWKRSWVVHSRNLIVGRVELGGPVHPYSLHRSILSMGVEEPFRKRGTGRKLVETAISWARNEPTLEWIELNVFAHNIPAIRLYQQMGFEEVGRTDDLFRINGKSISDLTMAMRLR